ncbi:protein translocase subunit SecDF [Cryomorpha ignava]|uniref:Multifunctional fusion protein n=1 Tax=Cryomorpha ignava TaxID=101383 RepID=A0A7K3WMI4_9FLAO|nr:protein translocase subunit SecDF [Cryomorpha ignava]NEN22863.1 protein translocase subunit SecDF [Cryomorpha ignava]
MQNKGAIWLFTILLALACLFQISFSFVTASFENKAEEVAAYKVDSVRTATSEELSLLEESNLLEKYKTQYLAQNSNTEIYPLFGYTYQESKSKQINLGLDLAGGMSVTLEVSIPDLILNLSNNVQNEQLVTAVNEAKKMREDSQSDFVTLFGEAWNKNFPDEQMASVFHSRDNKERFPRDASNQEILDILQEESKVAINNTEKILRTRIDKFGVTQPTIQKQQFSGRILVELPGVKDKDRVRKQLKSTANLEFWNTYENSEILGYLDQANTALSEYYNPNDYEDETNGVDLDTTLVDTSALDELAEDTLETAQAATDTTLTEAELLGLDSEDGSDTTDAAKSAELTQAEQLKKLPLFSKLNPALTQNGGPAQGSVVGYAAVSDTGAVNRMLKEQVVQAILPNDLRLLWSAEPAPGAGNVMRLYAIKVDTRDNKAPLDGSVIVDASQQYDMTGQVEVSMLMNSEGARAWKDITREASSQNPKRTVAIVLDNYVYSAPVVQSEIPTGQSSISMGQGSRNDQIQEALDLSNLLKAGALPAPANIVDESVVGPSLGQQNIDDGLLSFGIALAVVLLYMIFYYRGAGLVSDIALIANLFFLIGALASLKAALTLPGIAGIVLTIGMAVDANVLIYERIREELRNGKSVKAAVKEGYSKAYSAIIDANLTTLLTAIVLVTLGTGPIKGFATTLIIGIFTSLFSAIFITRLIFDTRLKKGKTLSFWMSWSKEILTNSTIPFIKKRKIAYIISAVAILISVGSLLTRGLNFGVDFTGGRTYTVRFDKPADLEEVRNVLAASFVEEGRKLEPEVKTFGASNQVKITTKFLVDNDATDADSRVEQALNEGLDQLNDPYTVIESRKVDPSISDDFQSSSLSAVFFALLIIFAYIVFRFRKWQYGVGAIAGMFHDVIIVLGFYSLLHGFLPFSLEIDQAFIAAILTVVGYSINDTVIVFDRIREYIAEHRKEKMAHVINKALNDTLSRTVNTSLTTFVVLLIIFIFGGESIRGFIFALMLGVFVGTYSSLYVASPLVVDLSDKTGASLEEAPKREVQATV